MTEIGRKIKEFREASGLTREAFALALGEKPSKIQDVESGRQRVNDQFLRTLIQTFSVDLNWLFGATGFGGEGNPRIEPPDQGKPLAGHFVADGEDYALVRRLDLSVSAGKGLVPVENGVSERLAFSRTWLMRNRLSADLCALVRVKGDSMAPTIPDGALVLLNVAERTSVVAGIYAFTRDGEAFIKRLLPARAEPDGTIRSLVIASDNSAYPPQIIDENDMAAIRIEGRVRAVLATF